MLPTVIGKPLEWDAKTLTVTNVPEAAKLISRNTAKVGKSFNAYFATTIDPNVFQD